MTASTPAKPTHRKRVASAIVAGIATFGVVGASAATLGAVTSANLGANDGTIASCDTDGVTLAFTNAYDATLGRYQTTSIAVSGINTACNGKAISVTLKDGIAGATGVSLGAASGTVAAGAATLALSGSGANAFAVQGAAVVISG